ncbi:platelet-activating factor acetylhydrolase-like isoform X6 [Zootermopsis nevadensis]|uniref:platelet-activating factor acetylhydrolase-like isoform X6 n=1 Tax=Zootermopsis nevadensis TaxID=136037 RepID=UPI000B8EA223|nr:platelet-activating factor acetylhydrolase-like isoform X6 [Zootermopsis nevadensis]
MLSGRVLNNSIRMRLELGPIVPGCSDLMTEFSRDGCFIRLFYPTSLSHIKKHSARWIPWLADDMYFEGFARVLQIWKFLIKFVVWLLAGNCHIPAVWNADVKQEGGKLPVVVFSHGLGATRFFYSSVCVELASHGFVVAAVEHRDKSASASYYYKSEDGYTDVTPTWMKFKVIGLGPGHYAARKKQVTKRVQECRKVIDILEKLNSGIYIENVLGRDFKLGQFKDRLNLTSLTMMGHSFGGATALLTLGCDCRLKGTTHESQADTPHLVGYWLNWKMKKLPPVIASRINNHLILDFLQKNIGLNHELDTSFLTAHAESVIEGIIEWRQ